jgi:hypothetical protein
VGKHWATTLVDTGSDASFISAKFAVKANLKISLVKAATVAAANGKKMCSKTACMDCSYNIQGYQFKSAFRLLELQGYDIILGADWIYAHSPVGLNLRTREFSITKDVLDLITFVDETLPDRNVIISPKKLCKLLKQKAVGAVMVLTGGDNSDQMSQDAAVSPEISTFLQEYEDIFQEPQESPPQRSVGHAITLIEGAKPVNLRQYRLPFHQKNAMEDLIKHMLSTQMIRPNISPYSSPVILVKKKDGNWRMCVDYKQLNFNTVKNKYPIPIIEDLLDELFGAQVFTKIDLRSGYHQIRMKEEDIQKTAFTTHLGHFEYVVMPFGLTNAPATFQSLMTTVLVQFLRKFALVFLMIYSSTTLLWSIT